MLDQSTEAANLSAQQAAGPPPSEHALTSSGLADQPKSPFKQFLDKVTGFVVGGRARG